MAIIGIDLDDCLSDFMSAYLALANKRFGRPEPGVMPVDWAWSNCLPDKDEQELVWQDTDAVTNFWETLSVMDGASARLLYKLDQRHEVYFPTARRTAGPTSIMTSQQSAYWIKKNFGIEFPRVIVSYEKGPLAVALKYDYFIDDRPKNCLDIQNALPNCKVYLKDSSHNQDFVVDQHSGIKRVKDFNEFANIILEG